MAWKSAGKVSRYLSNILKSKMEILFCSGVTAPQFLPALPPDYPRRQKLWLRQIYGGPSIKNGDIYRGRCYLSLCDWNKGRSR